MEPPSHPAGRLPVIELSGMLPRRGEYWCATCAILYIGSVNNDPDCQKKVQELVQKVMAEDDGKTFLPIVYFDLPLIPWRRLRPAITIAPSVYLQYAAPVCWVHLQGYAHQRMEESPPPAPSQLIPGKSWGRVKGTSS